MLYYVEQKVEAGNENVIKIDLIWTKMDIIRSYGLTPDWYLLHVRMQYAISFYYFHRIDQIFQTISYKVYG